MKNIKYHFCTLFSSLYLSKGLTLYESLLKNCTNFHLYVLAFDDISFNILQELKLKKLTVISLKDFEDEELLQIKTSRSLTEYIWTCKPSMISYCFEKYNLELCTYLDADLYFFNSPDEIFNEILNNSVVITEHRYTPKYDKSRTNGKYCAQFISFRNDSYGLKALNWWRKLCNNWCYKEKIDGKFGDQKYLDELILKFKGVHALKSIGSGVAPWNIQKYEIIHKNNSKKYLKEIKSNIEFALIFYHFHEVKYYRDNIVDLGNYILSKNVINEIYKPYITHLNNINEKIISLGYNIDPYGISDYNRTLIWKMKRVKRKIKCEDNVYDKKFLVLE